MVMPDRRTSTFYTTLDNFYLSKQQLEDSPSRRDGVSQADEQQLRYFGASLIADAAIVLKLQQVQAATAQVLFQRFYCKQSMKKHDVQLAAVASLWLACKVEECSRRVDDLLQAFHYVARRREGLPVTVLDCHGSHYSELKSKLLKMEHIMLQTFGFIMHTDHPHKLMLSLIQIVKISQSVMQGAWNLCNDSLRTTLCVRFKSEVVVCGLLFMAARQAKVALPEDPPIWQVFTSVSRSDVYEVCRTMYDLYKQPAPKYIPVASTPVSLIGLETKQPPPSPLTRLGLVSPRLHDVIVTTTTADDVGTGGGKAANGDAAAASVGGKDDADDKSERRKRSRERSRDRSRERERERKHHRHDHRSEGHRSKDRHRSRQDRDDRERSRDADKDRDKDRERDRDRDRERDRRRH